MKLKIIVISLLLMFLMASMNATMVTAPGTFEKFGPRVRDIIFRVAGNLPTEAEELQSGLIDLMDWAVPKDKITPWQTTYADRIIMEDYSEAGFYEYDLNLQMWPIGHGKMDGTKTKEGGAAPTAAMDWTFPPSWDQGHYWIDYTDQRCQDAKWFRKAIAYLTNRDAISSQYEGTIVPMETFIFPVIGGWENPSAPKYPYSVASAKAALDSGGFKDYDNDGIREYNKHVDLRNAWSQGQPAPVDTEEIPDIQVWRRTDDPPRNYAGLLLEQGFDAVSIQYDDNPGTYSTVTPHAWDDYDYHIYTGGWGWSSTPDMYYELWHSSKDIYPNTDGDNYNRYHRQVYDTIAENFKFAANLTAAKTNLDAAQVMIHDDVASIPLYTMAGYVAHRKNYGNFPGTEQLYKDLEWLGFANEQGYGYYGYNFGFTSLNAHPTGYERGGTLRHGLIDPPDKLDPVDSESFYEALIMNKIYEPLIIRDPFNTTNYLPWMVSSFQEGTWDNNGRTASKMTLQMLPNILWHDNVLLTPADVEFTYWYKREAMSVAEYTSVKEYHHSEISGNTITLFFNTTSFLVQPWVSAVTIIPKHIFQDYPPTHPGDPTVPGSWSFDPERTDNLIGTGPFRAFKDGVVGRLDISAGRDYIHLSANPTYFRELVRPDFVNSDIQPIPDGKVDIDDFGMIIGKFGDAKPWTDPTWGPITDVNKDFLVDIDDIMETGARYGQTGYQSGYPSYYG